MPCDVTISRYSPQTTLYLFSTSQESVLPSGRQVHNHRDSARNLIPAHPHTRTFRSSTELVFSMVSFVLHLSSALLPPAALLLMCPPSSLQLHPP
ncbi:hypothetical protein M405DRAFT_855824 [Rhizopogon salebrosus TDB-379]|nr:hypothetical protein M405DRAFT_855824 [Rhizopogon salebrosus TDB-379]